MCIIKTVKLFRLKTKRNHFKRVMRPQFSYCPLKWMFSPRKSNNLINKVRERSLRIGSSDNRNSFKSALTKCKETSIHQRNLQLLMTKLTRLLMVYLHQLWKKSLYYEKIQTT